MNADHRHALDAATEDLEAVKIEIQAFLATKPYRLTWKYDPKPHRIAVRAKVLKQPPPRLRQKIGSTVNNLRSALDYIAYELALANTNGRPKKPRAIYFPIFSTRKKFLDNGRPMIQEMALVPQKEIERLQPYYGRGALGTRNPLYLINEFCVAHKHRQLLLTGCVLGSVRIEGKGLRVIRLPGRGLAQLGGFDDDAVVAIADGLPGIAISASVEAAFGVAFTKRRPGRGVPVVDGLTHLRDSVRDVVFSSLEPFL